METSDHRPTWKTLLAFAIIYFVWGSTFLAIRLGPAEWSRKFRHPEQEKPLSLDDSLALYAWHGKHHVAHITSLCERQGWR